MNLEENEATGIQKKIKNQIASFEENGIEVNCFYYRDDYPIADLIYYDSVYVRLNQVIDHKLLSFLNRAKQTGCRVVMEIPTYPFNDEIMLYARELLSEGHFISAFYMIKTCLSNWYYSKKLKNCVDRVITFSFDSRIYDISCINSCNGVDVDSLPFFEKQHEKGSDIHAICVSTCTKWHGYDRFIKGLSDYYKSGCDRIIILDIVGEGDSLDEWKQITEDNKLGDYVIFHGGKTGSDLTKVYSYADVAIDSLGRHRSGVYYNSSLKGKEYAAMGLPIVSGVETELDYDPDYKYYLRVPADDSNIDILKVVEFVDRVYEDNKVAENIRHYAQEHFDYDVVMRPIVDYIKCTN